jgi:hypothetical protein
MLLHELSKQFHDDISGQVCIYVSIANNMTTGSNIRNMGQKQNSHGKTICALSKAKSRPSTYANDCEVHYPKTVNGIH